MFLKGLGKHFNIWVFLLEFIFLFVDLSVHLSFVCCFLYSFFLSLCAVFSPVTRKRWMCCICSSEKSVGCRDGQRWCGWKGKQLGREGRTWVKQQKGRERRVWGALDRRVRQSLVCQGTIPALLSGLTSHFKEDADTSARDFPVCCPKRPARPRQLSPGKFSCSCWPLVWSHLLSFSIPFSVRAMSKEACRRQIRVLLWIRFCVTSAWFARRRGFQKLKYYLTHGSFVWEDRSTFIFVRRKIKSR